MIDRFNRLIKILNGEDIACNTSIKKNFKDMSLEVLHDMSVSLNLRSTSIKFNQESSSMSGSAVLNGTFDNLTPLYVSISQSCGYPAFIYRKEDSTRANYIDLSSSITYNKVISILERIKDK